MSCKSCAFHTDGYCYRYPPQVYQESYFEHGDHEPSFRLESAWPSVGENDHCGEFIPAADDGKPIGLGMSEAGEPK